MAEPALPAALTPPTTAFWTHFSGATLYDESGDFSETVSRIGLYFFRQAFGQEVGIIYDRANAPFYYNPVPASEAWKVFAGFMAIILFIIAIVGAIAFYCSDTAEADWNYFSKLYFLIEFVKSCDQSAESDNLNCAVSWLGDNFTLGIGIDQFRWMLSEKAGFIKNKGFQEAVLKWIKPIDWTGKGAPPIPQSIDDPSFFTFVKWLRGDDQNPT